MLVVRHTVERNHILPNLPPHQPRKTAKMFVFVEVGVEVGQTKMSWRSLLIVWYRRSLSGLKLMNPVRGFFDHLRPSSGLLLAVDGPQSVTLQSLP